MEKVVMDKSSLDSYASKMGKVGASIDSLSAKIDNVNKSLDMDVKAKANIGTSLTKIKTNMTKEKEFYLGVQKGITRTKDDVFGEDTSLKSKILGTFGVISAIVTAAGGFIGNVISAITTPVESSTSPNTDKAGETQAETPAKSDDDYKNEINDRYQSILNKNNRSTYQGKCGALTNQQLLAKGIVGSKSEVATKDGKDLAANIAKVGTTKTGYSATTYGSFSDLINESKSRPVNNVVLSFNQGGSFRSESGHAMLIDRIENGKVYFIDNTSASSTAAKGNNGNYVAQCWTVDAFQKWYFANGNKSSGIVELHT